MYVSSGNNFYIKNQPDHGRTLICTWVGDGGALTCTHVRCLGRKAVTFALAGLGKISERYVNWGSVLKCAVAGGLS